MTVTFNEIYLQELYEKGVCDDKKHRFQPAIVKGYQKGIRFIMAAKSIEELWRIKSLNYEALIGDKKGRSSIRANNKYRIEFTVSVDNDNPILTICNIVELSNHYI